MTPARRAGSLALVALSMTLAHGDPARSAIIGEPAAKDTVKRVDSPHCGRAQFRVVLDVGHTAEASGAMSARGVPEYAFNLRLAKHIERNLIDAGFGRTVLLVTDGPTVRGLVKRVARANVASANLFLSIHHDSVPNAFLKNWDYEGKPSRFSDHFTGHSIFVSYDNSDRRGSLLFAKLLGNQLKARGLQYTSHYTDKNMGRRRRELVDAEAGVYRYDQLFVLRRTHMPAVLLEAGPIIHRDEELALAGEERQALISAATTDAVEEFCAAQSERKPDPGVTRRRQAPRGPQRAVRPGLRTGHTGQIERR